MYVRIAHTLYLKEVRHVLGTVSWYRSFVPDFSDVVAPITSLLKKTKKFSWSQDFEKAFRRVTEHLVSAPVLCCPDYSLPLIVNADASGFVIGAMFSQPHAEGDRPVCYLSRSLTRQERNYSTTERECLAVVYTIETLRQYIERD